MKKCEPSTSFVILSTFFTLEAIASSLFLKTLMKEKGNEILELVLDGGWCVIRSRLHDLECVIICRL